MEDDEEILYCVECGYEYASGEKHTESKQKCIMYCKTNSLTESKREYKKQLMFHYFLTGEEFSFFPE